MEKFLKKLLKKVNMPKVNKKKDLMSCILCMVLVVLASQSRIFDFLIDNNLGRLGLLALVFTICCTSKVFGAASVLFLVLAFAVQMNSREGMTCGKKKEGMCGKTANKEKKNEVEGFQDRLSQERDLQKGKQPYDESVKKYSSNTAEPHDTLESEYGSQY